MAVETDQRTGVKNQLGPQNVVRFDSLRDDWVKGADILVRLVARAIAGEVLLQGFPRQWLPILIHFDAQYTEPVAPLSYVPIASDLSAQDLEALCQAALSNGSLRVMVEAFASLDPLIADVLHKLDRRIQPQILETILPVKLTGWQSYGRPEVLALSQLIGETARAYHDTAVLLPCARRRPYNTSKTHRRIWSKLELNGIEKSRVDVLVVSSIGIVPEILWEHPVVKAYDSGVPDIYRVLRLLRRFFQKAKYTHVVDCLEFKPYSDCLEIVAREGLIGSVIPIPCGKRKSLPVP